MRYCLASHQQKTIHEQKKKKTFFKYKGALEIISMPGEIAGSLWTANESAFKKVKKHMEEGIKKGNDSLDLIKFKEHRSR